MEGKAVAQGFIIGAVALLPILLFLDWVMK